MDLNQLSTMTLSSILTDTSTALAFVAFAFLLMGFARKRRAKARPNDRTSNAGGTELMRRRAVQQADWKCGAVLLGLALVAYATTLIGNGAYYDEPSGNMAGGVLLIAGVVGSIVFIALIVRHVYLSHALRELN